jgi:hypothetical protein
VRTFERPRCRHYECQCRRALELAVEGRTHDAVEVHRRNQEVPCTRPPEEPAP